MYAMQRANQIWSIALHCVRKNSCRKWKRTSWNFLKLQKGYKSDFDVFFCRSKMSSFLKHTIWSFLSTKKTKVLWLIKHDPWNQHTKYGFNSGGCFVYFLFWVLVASFRAHPVNTSETLFFLITVIPWNELDNNVWTFQSVIAFEKRIIKFIKSSPNNTFNKL